MIALFDTFPRLTIQRAVVPSGVGLLMGMVVNTEDNSLRGLVITEDGSLTLVDAGYFTLDYHYDVEADKWEDINAETDQV